MATYGTPCYRCQELIVFNHPKRMYEYCSPECEHEDLFDIPITKYYTKTPPPTQTPIPWADIHARKKHSSAPCLPKQDVSIPWHLLIPPTKPTHNPHCFPCEASGHLMRFKTRASMLNAKLNIPYCSEECTFLGIHAHDLLKLRRLSPSPPIKIDKSSQIHLAWNPDL